MKSFYFRSAALFLAVVICFAVFTPDITEAFGYVPLEMQEQRTLFFPTKNHPLWLV